MARLCEPALSAEDNAAARKFSREVKKLEKEIRALLKDDDMDEYDELGEADENLNKKLMDMYRFYYGNLSESAMDKPTNLLTCFLEHTFAHSHAFSGEALQADYIDHYLGYWYITHVLNSGLTGIRDTCSALKKLASMMHQYKLISEEQLDNVNLVIKENKEKWLDHLRRYEELDPGAADFEKSFADIFY